MLRKSFWIMAAIVSISACAPSLQQNSLDPSQHVALFWDQATAPATRGPSSLDDVAATKPTNPASLDDVGTAKPAKPPTRVAKRTPAVDSHANLGPAITVEPDAKIDDTLKNESKLVSGLIALVRARGYQCGAVSAIKPFDASNGFNLACDRYRYKYAIEDNGGGWNITAE